MLIQHAAAQAVEVTLPSISTELINLGAASVVVVLVLDRVFAFLRSWKGNGNGNGNGHAQAGRLNQDAYDAISRAVRKETEPFIAAIQHQNEKLEEIRVAIVEMVTILRERKT